jgi:HlyD family secretion protein
MRTSKEKKMAAARSKRLMFIKKVTLSLFIILALGVVGFNLYGFNWKSPEATFKTARVERGTIISSVSATGTLSAVTTVQVGTQVSGMIKELYVDFNSPVRKGQPIAQIDPALFEAQVEQSRGNYLTAQASLDKAKVTVADAKRTLERKRELVKNGYIAQSDFDAAQTAYDSALASLKGAEGEVAQTRGAYQQARTNLAYSTIRSPVDGIVVSRNVDVGQTVAASFQTPTLFTIAEDLTKMQIDTSVDEADIGRVKEGQPATFTVDAYPEMQFQGKVTQIRNAPIIIQNVVTYIVVINVENKDLKLKPGMTANVNVEVSRKDNVLKIPTAALRFRPKAEGELEGKTEAAESPRKGTGSGQQVYILGKNKQPLAIPVNTGISNDTRVELVEGNLQENDLVIVEQVLPKKKPTSTMGTRMGPRF